jgi:hypothetical protein
MKEEILNQFDGQYCTIDDIVAYVETLGEASRKTVIWNVNGLIRQGKANLQTTIYKNPPLLLPGR